ncbi:helix-turn-helix domain-containing protein (plasmid) [Embleya sp. NBC_00888]|uniref:PucR family transcriptional regulator n=1 Tax=Embleya sp. NBC_00888 TaxID=2975960 RepID=UPI002F912A27|nr:helix-turn-helix domain-containing protein [Embleya sp. NBC_00888]
MSERESSGRRAAATLARVLDLIDPGILDVVVAPRGTEVPVNGVTLYDLGDEDADGSTLAGMILLAVGVEPRGPGAVEAVRAARRAGASALVIRRGAAGADPAAVEAAQDGGIALLTRHPGRGWTDVLGLLRNACAQSSPSELAAVDSLRPGDLSGLANTVADLVGGAITIEDPQSRVLAYSRMDHEPDPMRRATILNQEVPRWRVAELRESGFFRTLWGTDDVVRLPADDRYAERLAIAVRDGGEVLGSIWAAADGHPLAPDAAAALRTAARAALPHLVHHETRGREAARRREEAVHALLSGGAGAEQAARTVGVRPDRPYGVIVVEAYESPTTESASDAPTSAEQRVLDVLALQAAALRPGCVTARAGRRLFVLTPAGEAHADPARDLVATARSVPGTVVFAGVGPIARRPAELPGAREEAEIVVRVLRERATAAGVSASASASAADVVSEAALVRLLDRVEPLWPMAGPVYAMVEHDRLHGSGYSASVGAYLGAFGDTVAAARGLSVHPNTLRYRLRRAKELFGVDLDDPTGRLLADIGLRLAHREHG